MKKGYLYLVFIALSSVVVIAIALIFKFVNTKENLKESSLERVNSTYDKSSLVELQTYEDSWIIKLLEEKKQKVYLYPVQKYHIEFN